MIDAYRELVQIDCLRRREGSGTAAIDTAGIVVQNRQRLRTERPVDLVAWKLRPCGDTVRRLRGQRIIDRLQARSAEIASPLRVGRHNQIEHQPLTKPLYLIAQEEERPVPPAVEMWNRHRTAEDAAKLIALQNLSRSRKVVPGVQLIVTDKLEYAAMKFVRAGFGRVIEESAAAVELRRVRVLLHAELLQRIDRYLC